jgi:hypothetical protein
MDHARRTRSVLATIVVGAALATTACTGSASPALATPSTVPAAKPLPMAAGTSPSARVIGPSSIPDSMLAVGVPGERDLRVIFAATNEELMTMPIGATDASWGRIVSVTPGAKTTDVQEHSLTSGPNGPVLTVDGRWRLPSIGGDPVPVGRSANNATVVLVEDRPAGYDSAATSSRFLVLREAGRLSWEVAETLDLKSAFEFDALSPDGSTLYVVEHLDAGSGGRYQVRKVSIASGAVDPTPITDKRFLNEPMAGVPITQLRQTGGLVLTLYRGPEHPFVHALNSVDGWAMCIDLPANGASDAAAAQDWGLTESADGETVYAVNATVGIVADIDPNDFTVRRTARIPATTAAGAQIVLAKFGHDEAGAIGGRTVLTPDGTLLAGGKDGLTAIGADDFAVRWQALAASPVQSLALMPDGKTVFVLSAGQIDAVRTSDGTVLGAVPGKGFDRLVAVVPA